MRAVKKTRFEEKKLKNRKKNTEKNTSTSTRILFILGRMEENVWPVCAYFIILFLKRARGEPNWPANAVLCERFGYK